MMVVVYIVAKRSYYFVPNFARNVVMMPFRSRWGVEIFPSYWNCVCTDFHKYMVQAQDFFKGQQRFL